MARIQYCNHWPSHYYIQDASSDTDPASSVASSMKPLNDHLSIFLCRHSELLECATFLTEAISPVHERHPMASQRS